MECRKILLKAQEERKKAKEEKCQILAKINPSPPEFIPNPIDHLIKEYEFMLTLELPFQIDTVDMNVALIDSQARETQPSDLSFIEEKIPLIKGSSPMIIKANQERRAKRKYFSKLFESYQPEATPVSYSSNGVMRYGNPVQIPTSELFEESIHAPREALKQNINRSKYQESFKKVIRSTLEPPALDCDGHDKTRHSKKIAKGADFAVLSQYFLYLENKCLESWEIENYRKWVRAHLLFYVNEPIETQINSITLNNIKNCESKIGNKNYKRSEIIIENKSYPVPDMFVEMAKALYSENEPLFGKSIKQFGRYLEESTKAAKLRQNITAKMIQRSLPYLCAMRGYIPQKLPPR